MSPWIPALPQQRYTRASGLNYRRIYVATVDRQLRNRASLARGFPTTHAPQDRPRIFVGRAGPETIVPTSQWRVARQGTILTTGLDSCVAIAVAALDGAGQRCVAVAMAHLTGSYYPGGGGALASDGDWSKLFDEMPEGIPLGRLYAVVAGSSHRGGWDTPEPNKVSRVMGGEHREGYASNPDEVWKDLAPKRILKSNFSFYTLAPGICNTMGFAIRLDAGFFGEV